MARIQYNPQAQARGFNPAKLSSEGVARMREESNRIIKNLKENAEIERQQRAKTLAAMKADAAYSEQEANKNFQINLANIRNAGAQEIADSLSVSKQSQVDAQNAEAILNSLADFAPKLQERASKNFAKMVEDQTQVGLNTEFQNIADQVEESSQAAEALLIGGMQLNANIKEDAAEGGERLSTTFRRYRANHGLNGWAAMANDNKVAEQAYDTVILRRLADADTVFTTSYGKKFTGSEANNSLELYNELHQITLRDVSRFMGFTDPGYLQTANANISKAHGVRQTSIEARQIKNDREGLIFRAKEIGAVGTVAAVTSAAKQIADVDGWKAAHEYLRDEIKSGRIDPNVVGEIKLGKEKYSVEWKEQFDAAVRELNTSISKQAAEQAKEDKRNADLFVQNNYDQYKAYVREVGVDEAERAFGDTFKGQIPDRLKTLLRIEEKAIDEDLFALIDDKSNDYSLTPAFINELEDPDHIKYAKAKLEEMNNRRYSESVSGEDYSALIAGVKDWATKLAKNSSLVEGDTTAQIELNKASVRAAIHEDLIKTSSANATFQNISNWIATASLQPGDPDYDKDNPFSYTETEGRRVYRKIGNVDNAAQSERLRITRAVIKLNPNKTQANLGEVLTKVKLFDKEQFDKMKAAAEAGQPIPFTEGVQAVGDMFNQGYLQIVNTVATAKGFDPIDPNATPASILPNKYQRLLNSDNFSKINRVKQTVANNLSANVRPSMNPGWRKLSSVIRFGEGTSDPRGYYRQFTGTEFTDTSDHPRQLRSGGGYTSNAAGAYQMLDTTWDEAKNELGLRDFSPESQERAARYLTQRRGVDPDQVFQTKEEFKEALDKLAPEWASLPYSGISPGGYGQGGSYYGQPAKTFDELWEIYQGS